ncbi:PTS transporter subunit EIIC [Fructobacillus americanaquae]|uniref:PTS transporter subunit EIIC n=1 Tax=Fructobacillus americanaquae TaxID=2940302 RepID=A0ABY5C0P4_9LACO|nr:PTS transporter subunit EIIC [Fructobacillus americanaquae]USS91649.1 PTS transporter subunit EIIC [Fructobacillus americanaquae]
MFAKILARVQRWDRAWVGLSPIKNLFSSFKLVIPLVIIDVYWRLITRLFLDPGALFATIFHYKIHFFNNPLISQGISNVLDYLVVAFTVALWTKKYLTEKLSEKRDPILPVTVNFGLVLIQTFSSGFSQGQLTIHLGLCLLITYLINLTYLGLTKITKDRLQDMGFTYLSWAAIVSILVVVGTSFIPNIVTQGTYTTFFSSDFFAHYYSLALVAVLAPILFVLGISIPLDLSTGATDLAQVNTNLNAVYQSVMATLPQPQNPYSVLTASAMIGGVGATLGLALILIFAKSKQNRRLGLWSLLPALFDNNRILAYGIPLFLRPLTLVPMILSSLFGSLSASVAIKLDFVRPTVFSAPSGTPHLLLGFMASQTPWRSLILAIFVLLGSILIYWPFVKDMVKKEVKHG